METLKIGRIYSDKLFIGSMSSGGVYKLPDGSSTDSRSLWKIKWRDFFISEGFRNRTEETLNLKVGA